jgi:RimJ/RimL family protein N-acetyltransferase
MKKTIRKFEENDWDKLWPILENVFRAGETYPFPTDITEEEVHQAWIGNAQETFVAVSEDGQVLGTYYIKPNQPGLASHVCNCGYIVAEDARGKGIATNMCTHSQVMARKLGFKAMQFNLVVSTNRWAIRLWKKCGFQLIGILPKAFKNKKWGYVNACIMYKEL